MDYIKYVNVFQGTGKYAVPSPNSLYARWNLLKGKAGNTSPAACLPFGSVACSPYSGGYPVGYGKHMINGGKRPRFFIKGNKTIGFSHFTHSGIGAIGVYYNYLITSPYLSEFENSQALKDYDEEKATTGYYACRLVEENIGCEVTVSEKAAIHRYTSLGGAPLKIAIDVSNNGLRQKNKKLHGEMGDSKIRLYPNGQIGGYVTAEEVKLYFYVVCSDETSVGKIWTERGESQSASFFGNGKDGKFGCLLETESKQVELKIGFSLVSEANAKRSALNAKGFDETAEKARRQWKKQLSAIQLYGVSKRDKEIFYSNYYHTLVKPCGWKKESFLWKEKGTFFVDFATLWDVYKTQIPLLFTLYRDVGRGIVKTLLRYGKERNGLFNALLLSMNMKVESQQACCLGCYVLYDAYRRGMVELNELDDLFSVVRTEIENYAESVRTGSIEKTTKLLDVCLVAQAYVTLASELGRADDEKYFSELADHWTVVFSENGLLKEEYPYYEGNHWNYSFRFVRDREKRVRLGGGKEKLVETLDKFFAFDESNPVENRFEGFNNETDMETPYFYHYVGRYDRLTEILEECTDECFRTGRDGLPGNNDSGGLSACYLWNFLGLFPISGGDGFFLGSPKAKKATLRLSNGNRLTVLSVGKGRGVEKVTYNGELLTGYEIPVEKIMQGGTLVFYKKGDPCEHKTKN